MNWKRDFNWAGAIELNREALNRIVAALFALLGIDGTDTVSRIPRSLHRAVLRVLRPAESALRRLIVIAARGVVVKLVPPRSKPAGKIPQGRRQRPLFQLFDPRKRFAELRQHRPRIMRNPPRIHVFGNDPRVVALWPSPRPVVESPPPPDGLVNAARLTRRLQALKSALDDLPRQAKRLVRLRARREKVPSLRLKSPLRPGRPPGHRRKLMHEVDEILTECHGLACWVMEPDTS
ncbi:MAG TPA: hypothetical protein VM144_11045 [Aestuariivirga sp.]|nr:hypothetical protein [Aestuariivirga sp.]